MKMVSKKYKSRHSYSEKDVESIYNGRAYGAVSLADIDGDDKQEIIVPTFYGVRVYDLKEADIKNNNFRGVFL